MNSAKLLRYSMQLSMLKQLRSLKLISEAEYQLVEKKLKKDYGVISKECIFNCNKRFKNLWLQFFLSQNQGFMRLFEKTVLK